MHTVAILGAGAMGCLFAARLARAGADVTVVDVDQERLRLIAQQGITLRDDSGEAVVPVTACLATDLAGPFDLAILFTKGMHSAAAVASVAHLADGRTPMLTLQNGIGNADIIAATFPEPCVLMGVTDYPADLQGPALVSSHGHGHIRLGGYGAAAQGRAAAAADLLNTAGLGAVHDAHVLVAIWEKLAFNAALNSLGAVTGLPNGGIDGPEGRRLIAGIVSETVAVAHALGIAVEQAGIMAKISAALAGHRGHKASMLQDRIAGRATEIEFINGAIERCARQHGVPVPITSTLADLVRIGEQQALVKDGDGDERR